jgi:hypothetical protein
VVVKPFDEELYALKLQDALVPRMHRDSQERRHKVLAHQREIGQGLAGALSKLVDSDISLIRDYIPEVDRACRETWLSDGNLVTADFVRNLLVHRVFGFIAVREGNCRGNLERFARRCGIGGTHLTPALDHLVRNTNKLKREVSTRYEIEAIELSKKESRTRQVPRAPAPPSEVGGLGVSHSSAKPTQIPPDFPLYFPKELKARTAVILAEAVRKFQYQTQTLELCKHVISEMMPLFCEAVKNGTVKASTVLEEGLGGVGDLLRSLLVYNDDGHTGWGLSNDAYRFQQEARKSDEWLRLAKAIVEAEEQRKYPALEQNKPHELSDAQRVKELSSSTANPAQNMAEDRRALVKAYIEEVRGKTGKRITKKDIWSKAGYLTRTEFERWERRDPRHPNKAADETFTRIIGIEKPHLK